jgi:multisubunit Na+/H+ antiporter MnhG subunit
VNPHRHFSKTALVAFLLSALTTPLTTLALLELAVRPGTPLFSFVSSIPYATRAALVALVLIGLPLFSTFVGSLALRRVSSSWTPMSGAGLARSALTLGILSTLAATIIFALNLLSNGGR